MSEKHKNLQSPSERRASDLASDSISPSEDSDVPVEGTETSSEAVSQSKREWVVSVSYLPGDFFFLALHKAKFNGALVKHPACNFPDIVTRLVFHKQHVFIFKLAD